MSLIYAARPVSGLQCLKACLILEKSCCQKINECQSVRVMTTYQSTNVRRMSYTLKNADERRSLCPFNANTPLKRYQSISLNGVPAEETCPFSSKFAFKSFAVGMEEVKDKMAQFFLPAPQNNSAAIHSSAKPYNSIPGPKSLPGFGSALDYTKIGKFSAQEFHVALRDRHNK